MKASSPGEGLSQTPPGLGGILGERDGEREPPVAPTTCSDVFSRWTHTHHQWLTSALSSPLCNSIVTAVLKDGCC